MMIHPNSGLPGAKISMSARHLPARRETFPGGVMTGRSRWPFTVQEGHASMTRQSADGLPVALQDGCNFIT